MPTTINLSNEFLDGYNQFCSKTSCQWVDEKDKQKRLDSIAKTFNNRRIDNNVMTTSTVCINRNSF